MDTSEELLKIAKEHLFLDTLETRNSDSLDFSDQAIWNIKAALEAAVSVGQGKPFPQILGSIVLEARS